MTRKFDVPESYDDVRKVYGDFKYTESLRVPGNIDVDPSWERANITRAGDLPGFHGFVRVHSLIVDPLREAFELVQLACPTYEIYHCVGFVPRHKLHRLDKPLSIHSWGAAVDINQDANRYGSRGDMPEEFIEAFEHVGFQWGGRWSHKPDPMHFQLAYRV